MGWFGGFQPHYFLETSHSYQTTPAFATSGAGGRPSNDFFPKGRDGFFWGKRNE